jgi:hypothetical protein
VSELWRSARFGAARRVSDAGSITGLNQLLADDGRVLPCKPADRRTTTTHFPGRLLETTDGDPVPEVCQLAEEYGNLLI